MSDKTADLPWVCLVRGDQELADLAQTNGLSPDAAQAVASIDAVLQKIRRSMMKREFGRQVLAAIDPELETAHLDVISAIGYVPVSPDEAREEVTVGLIAERLSIDPSRASRVAAEVVERGYAIRVASQSDARRICLELTPRGSRFIDAVRVMKWKLFSRALGQWNERDLVAFAALFERFSSWTTDLGAVGAAADEIKQMLGEDAPPTALADAQ
jgi:DNA-binding MarR family transcriptional regulator